MKNEVAYSELYNGRQSCSCAKTCYAEAANKDVCSNRVSPRPEHGKSIEESARQRRQEGTLQTGRTGVRQRPHPRGCKMVSVAKVEMNTQGAPEEAPGWSKQTWKVWAVKASENEHFEMKT